MPRGNINVQWLMVLVTHFGLTFGINEDLPCWMQSCTDVEYKKQVPLEVHVGGHLNRLASLDIDTQSIQFDIYLWFRWDTCTYDMYGSIPQPHQTYDLDNLIDRWGLTIVDKAPSCNFTAGQAYYLTRLQAVFNQRMNFADYPLDLQEILLTVEAADNEVNSLVYVPDPGGFTVSQISNSLPGWYIERLIYKADIKVYDTNWGISSNAQQTKFAIISFGVVLSRPKTVYLLKILLPIVIVEFVSIVGFLNDIGMAYDTRMGTASGTLLGAIFLQLSFGDKLPRGIEYLTLMDWMFNIAYLSILFVIVETIIVKYVY